MGNASVPFTLHETTLPGTSAPVYFVDCPRFYDRPSIYTGDPDEPFRFLFFCRAVFESCQRLAFAPDILHCNDWQTALVPLMKKTLYGWDRLFSASRSLLTIHNIAYQGVYGAGVLDALGGIEPRWLDATDLRERRINFLKTGLLHADRLTTVSPTYAVEIQTPEQGYGLDALLRKRAHDLTGILNGVDYGEWDPGNDRLIPRRYSASTLAEKESNKEALAARLGLDYGADVPLVGMASRLSHQKGIELLYDALPAVLSTESVQLAVLGTGESRYEGFFESLQTRFPDRVRFYRGFDEELAHWIEAGADFFLMPSRYEPCGLSQMYSLRYGTIPIVRRTGGLADSVRLFDPSTGEGTGIVFDHFTADAVAWALRFANRLFHDPVARDRVRRNGMAEDFSWARQAGPYLEIYRRLLLH
jgi:starch synthase